jgi:formylglycine-generating enzyme required for sulfatase activity
MVKIPGKDYLMGKYEVTQAQWEAIMGKNRSRFKGDLSRPVEGVSWNDCQEFIQKLNARTEVKSAGIIFRLPTEEQWEYACRAGSTGKYGLLADGREGILDEMGWYDDNSGYETHPVGQKKPNAWGLYDMHGNVREWTASWDSNYSCICRGGSWRNSAGRCGVDYRSSYIPDYWYGNLGFRLAASRTGK